MALKSSQNEPSNQLMRRPPEGNVSYHQSGPDDEDAKLERRALEAKNAAQKARKSIPPFVQKLSRCVGRGSLKLRELTAIQLPGRV